jgi:RNA-binding protein
VQAGIDIGEAIYYDPRMELTPKQRQYLKGLAHTFEPIVRIGGKGLTDGVVEETKKSLAAHELIKIRIEGDDPKVRHELAENLAKAADAQLAGSVGKIAILYRARDEKPAIKLPA